MAGSLIRLNGSNTICNIPGPVGQTGASPIHSISPGPHGFNNHIFSGPQSLRPMKPEAITVKSYLLSNAKIWGKK